jgi:hypothetical protein
MTLNHTHSLYNELLTCSSSGEYLGSSSELEHSILFFNVLVELAKGGVGLGAALTFLRLPSGGGASLSVPVTHTHTYKVQSLSDMTNM